MNHKYEGKKGVCENVKQVANEVGIHGLIWRSMENVIKALKISGVLLGLLLLYDRRIALASSGGCMGGDSFDSSDSSDISYTTFDTSDGDFGSSITDSTNPTPVRPLNGSEVIAAVSLIAFMVFLCIRFWNDLSSNTKVTKTSVLKLQIGSLGTGRLLQKDLNRIAELADTSTSRGFNYVLQEAILALLRHSDYCVSGYSSMDVKKSVGECKKQFNKVANEERGKSDEVTIIVAARGVPELPPIKSSAQLKEALQKLASIRSSNIMGANVLWTPQKEDDSLTEQEMREDYPMLHPL
ncbi:hypothetical protein QVD17_23950 [Tagetes erecta]|uniref:Uncharacterized protein n=1 Tax=Tagetes erecta TaxID=13708 RepID=A0AAD8KEM6_TARER|nr:hypothetical protein QVD17_23950 [Tagetes erecta]